MKFWKQEKINNYTDKKIKEKNQNKQLKILKTCKATLKNSSNVAKQSKMDVY